MLRGDWKEMIRAREGYRCKICGRTTNLTIQHKLPRCRGGSSTPENCVCWCGQCHRRFHLAHGLAMSDDFGNPIEHGYIHRKPPKRKHRRHCKHHRHH